MRCNPQDIPSASMSCHTRALVQLSGITLRTVAPKVGHPFAHVTAAPILSEELSDAVTPLALTLRAFNAQYVEFTSNIAEGEIGVRAILRRNRTMLLSKTVSRIT